MIEGGAVRHDREPPSPHRCREVTDRQRRLAASSGKGKEVPESGQNRHSSISDDSRLDAMVVRRVANRRLRTLENLESLIRHPPSRIKAVHAVRPCNVQIPTVAAQTDFCDDCLGASITCFQWLDREACRAL